MPPNPLDTPKGTDFLRLAIGTAFLLLIAIVPIPLGSNRDWAWAPLAVVVGAMLLLDGPALMGRHRYFPTRRQLAFLAGAMMIVIVWAFYQAGVFTGMPEAPSTVRQEVSNRISIDPERTVSAAMRLMAYCGIFFVAAQFSAHSAYAARLCLVVIVSAVAVTIYGWFTQTTIRACIAFTVEKRPLESGDPCLFSGTFVNSGNYATYAGLAALTCVAMLHGLIIERISGITARQRWRARLMNLTGRGGLLLGALLVLLSGIVYSSSRAGVASFAVAAVVMVTLLNVLQHRSRGATVWSALAILALLIAIVASSGEGVINRSLSLLSEGDRDRVLLYEMTRTMISLRPITGWGLGSFETVFSIFQPARLELPYDKAHNFYLETVMEMGLPVAILFLLVTLAIVGRCLLGISRRHRDAQYPALAVGATVLIAVQSLVDFGVQIPAVAATYSALLGMGWAQSWTSEERQS